MRNYHNTTQKVSGLLYLSRFMLGISDILGRKVVTALTVIAVAMAIMVSLLLNGYGHQIYHAQEALVRQEVPTVLAVSCGDPTDLSQRLTDERLSQLGADGRIVSAYPRIEINVTLQFEGKTTTVPAESIIPEDPRLEPTRLFWSSSKHIPGKEGLVIAKRLFEKMGGLVVSGLPTPDSLTLRVARTRDGKRQEDALTLPIAAIMKHKNEDSIYVPIEIAERLDLFCSHKSQAIQEGKRLALRYPGAIAYVPESELGRVHEEAKNLNIELKDLGQVACPDWNGPVWVSDTSLDDAMLIEIAQHGDLYTHQSMSLVIRGEDYVVAGLNDDDSRWKDCIDRNQEPEQGTFYSTSDKAANRLSSIYIETNHPVSRSTATSGFPVAADLVCTLETFKRMAFELNLPHQNQPCRFVYTTSIETATKLHEAVKGSLRTSHDGFAWSLFHVNDHKTSVKSINSGPSVKSHVIMPGRVADQRSHLSGVKTINWRSVAEPNSLPTKEATIRKVESIRDIVRSLDQRYPLAKVEQILSGRAEVKNKRLGLSTYEVIVRFLPNSLFERVVQTAGVKSLQKSGFGGSHLNAIAVGDQWHKRPKSVRISGNTVRVVGHLPGWEDNVRELWFSDYDSPQIEHTPITPAIASFGDWSQWWKTYHALNGQNRSVVPYVGSYPKHYGIFLKGQDSASIKHILKAPDAAIESYQLSSFVQHDKCSVRIHSTLPAEAKQLLHQFYPHHKLLNAEQYIPALYRATRSGDTASLPGMEKRIFRFASAYDHYRAQQLPNMAEQLKPHTPFSTISLRGFTVRDLSGPDGSIDERLLATLAMTQPTFFKTEPQLSLDVKYGPRHIQVKGVEPHSLERYRSQLLVGDWPQKQNEILLASGMCDNLDEARKVLGKQIELAFLRGDRTSYGNQLVLSFKVVGVYQDSSDSGLLANDSMVRNASLWRSHQVFWNHDEHRFERPSQVYERQGHVRATVIAHEVKNLDTLVQDLDQQGYRCESALGRLEGLRRLGKLLSATTYSFSLGLLLIASFSIFVSGYSQIRTKTWEIALYKSLGCRTLEILHIFLFEGLIIGSLAFFVGAASVVLIEPFIVRPVLTEILHLNFDDIIEGFIAIPWKAFPVAFCISMLFVLMGVLIPAWKACQGEDLGVALKRSE